MSALSCAFVERTHFFFFHFTHLLFVAIAIYICIIYFYVFVIWLVLTLSEVEREKKNRQNNWLRVQEMDAEWRQRATSQKINQHVYVRQTRAAHLNNRADNTTRWESKAKFNGGTTTIKMKEENKIREIKSKVCSNDWPVDVWKRVWSACLQVCSPPTSDRDLCIFSVTFYMDNKPTTKQLNVTNLLHKKKIPNS